MNLLPTSTALGELEMLEVYVQYNGPRLFSCRNKVGQTLLGLWVDEEDEFDLWLYVLISLDRLKQVRVGEIDIRSAFEAPESNFIYEVKLFHAEKSYEVQKLRASEVDEDCLPLENSFLKCSPETLPALRANTAIQNAIQKVREVVNLVSKGVSTHMGEIPSLQLGEFLTSFQLMINSIKSEKNWDSKISRAENNRQTEYNVFATGIGSFRVELASAMYEPDMFDQSLAGDAIEELLRLIEHSNDTQSLQQHMMRLPSKAAPKYRAFLEAVVKSGGDLEIEWGSPSLNRGGIAKVPFDLAKATIEAIKEMESENPREFEIIGELFKIDKVNWKFGIDDRSGRARYKGDISDEAKGDAATATISHFYHATIRELPEISLNGDRKVQYQLLALRPYEPDIEQLSLIQP